ncbi:MAG: hypothetical protein RIQ74_694, partial [Pseudomonadota bacterium]
MSNLPFNDLISLFIYQLTKLDKS